MGNSNGQVTKMTSDNPEPLPATLSARTAAESQVRLLKEVNVSVCDEHGKLELGHLLEWMDAASCLAAEKHCGRCTVTMMMDDLSFAAGSDQMARRAEVCVLEGKVTRAFGTSMEVAVTVAVADVSQSSLRSFCHAYFVYVALKSSMDDVKIDIPQLMPQTSLEHIEYDLAEKRKSLRIQRETRLTEMTPQARHDKDGSMDAPSFHFHSSSSSSSISSFAETSAGPSSLDCGKVRIAILSFTELVLPYHANHMGNTFGGQIMNWMAKASRAALWLHLARCAVGRAAMLQDGSEPKGIYLQPLAIDRIHFKSPSHVGDRIQVRAMVTRVFDGHIVEVLVEVTSAGVGTQDSPTDINEGFFTYAVNMTNRGAGTTPPTAKISDVLPETVEQEEQHRRAVARQHWRMQRQTETEPKSAVKSKNAEELATLCISAIFRLNCSTELCWQRLPVALPGIAAFMNRDRNTEGAQTRLKISSTINRSPRACYDLLRDLDRRKDWDSSCIECDNLRSISEDVEIYRMVTGSCLGETEVLLLRACRAHEATGGYVIASRSVRLEGIPPRQNCRRGEVLPSGYIITPSAGTNATCTDLTFIGQFENLVFENVRPCLMDIYSNLRNLLESETDKTDTEISRPRLPEPSNHHWTRLFCGTLNHPNAAGIECIG